MTKSSVKTVGRRPKKMEVLSNSLHRLNSATLKAASLVSPWTWHYGTVNGLGFFAAGGHEVVILWDEGGASRKQGGIPDEQWEIFRVAFEGSGRIAVLSDKQGTDWKFDYRFLEARRS